MALPDAQQASNLSLVYTTTSPKDCNLLLRACCVSGSKKAPEAGSSSCTAGMGLLATMELPQAAAEAGAQTPTGVALAGDALNTGNTGSDSSEIVGWIDCM
jgi:hypothetical protein